MGDYRDWCRLCASLDGLSTIDDNVLSLIMQFIEVDILHKLPNLNLIQF